MARPVAYNHARCRGVWRERSRKRSYHRLACRKWLCAITLSGNCRAVTRWIWHDAAAVDRFICIQPKRKLNHEKIILTEHREQRPAGSRLDCFGILCRRGFRLRGVGVAWDCAAGGWRVCVVRGVARLVRFQGLRHQDEDLKRGSSEFNAEDAKVSKKICLRAPLCQPLRPLR